jgi:hypothetical protein
LEFTLSSKKRTTVNPKLTLFADWPEKRFFQANILRGFQNQPGDVTAPVDLMKMNES